MPHRSGCDSGEQADHRAAVMTWQASVASSVPTSVESTGLRR